MFTGSRGSDVGLLGGHRSADRKVGAGRQASMCAVLEGWREASEVEQG